MELCNLDLTVPETSECMKHHHDEQSPRFEIGSAENRVEDIERGG
jgi:hypothetical protein